MKTQLTSDRNHLKMSRLELPFQRCLKWIPTPILKTIFIATAIFRICRRVSDRIDIIFARHNPRRMGISALSNSRLQLKKRKVCKQNEIRNIPD